MTRVFLFLTHSLSSLIFFFNDTATTEIYTLSLHDALPIYSSGQQIAERIRRSRRQLQRRPYEQARDRKSTRLNSSYVRISYAVFCLKKKKKPNSPTNYHHITDTTEQQLTTVTLTGEPY